jgi:hypothetical protein
MPGAALPPPCEASMRDRDQSRRHILRYAVALGATALTGALPRRAMAQAPRRTVNIVNTASNSTFALQELLRQQGYLEEFGLDAKILNVGDGSKLMGALLNGGSDICLLSGFSQVFPAVEHGGKLRSSPAPACCRPMRSTAPIPQCTSSRILKAAMSAPARPAPCCISS